MIPQTHNALNGLTEPLEKRHLRWYTCGPTVYDSAHMGHARTYVTFDIMRRILEGHFGKHIEYVMNITDIDDKIINRAAATGEDSTTLARRYEEAFWTDMDALGVARPTRVLRVTESIKEIVEFIEVLLHSGAAYVAPDSSVYFDTEAFAKKQSEPLPFVPICETMTEALPLREGKKAVTDFALWKAASDDGPGWLPTWSSKPGRPGWHIECSTMAYMAFGSHFDIHSGGVDLCFPHHANEISQTIAYNEAVGAAGTGPIDTFWHSGHLHIEGRKMSKSEKNFITIREALGLYSATSLRLWFVDSKYSAPIHFSHETMIAYVGMEKDMIDWFARVRRSHKNSSWNMPENTLAAKLATTQKTVDEALAADFDTPGALRALTTLVHETNVYMATCAAVGEPNHELLLSIARYVERMFRLFGITDTRWSIIEPAAETAIAPALNALADFRTAVRGAARTAKAWDVLKVCDHVRDTVAPTLGIRMEDADGKTVWKYVG